MTRPRITSFTAASGFTLIEVMVSAAILAIVLAVMFSALSTSMSLWRNTDNKIVADREARAVELLLAPLRPTSGRASRIPGAFLT
jgi:prepilin-type N-terminal cleavage/methylation domain-containing protein